MFRKAKLLEKALIILGVVKWIRFTSISYMPQCCQEMSQVNKMYFTRCCKYSFPCYLQVYLAVIRKKKFQCNLYIWLMALFPKMVALWISS